MIVLTCDRCGRMDWRNPGLGTVPDATPCTTCRMGWLKRRSVRQ